MVFALRYFESGITQFPIVKHFLDNIVYNCPRSGAISVMDIGCGSGRLLLEVVVPMLPKNFTELIGIDKSRTMIEYCRTINTDPRMSFEQLDITTKHLPNKFLKRFDLITSFLCLHYVDDYNQTIKNIHNMLKPNGEVIYIQAYNLNPLYDTYRELCKIDRWRPFLQQFENYSAHFSGSDRESELEDIYRRNALKLLKYNFAPLRYKVIPKIFEGELPSIDTVKKVPGMKKSPNGTLEIIFVSKLAQLSVRRSILSEKQLKIWKIIRLRNHQISYKLSTEVVQTGHHQFDACIFMSGVIMTACHSYQCVDSKYTDNAMSHFFYTIYLLFTMHQIQNNSDIQRIMKKM